jgi:hypothetical protein
MTSAEVLVQYQQQLAELQSALDALQTKQGLTAACIGLALLAALVAGFLSYSRHSIPGWCSPLALSPALVSVRNYGRRKLQAHRLRRLRTHYQRGQARLNGLWAGHGHAGFEFQPERHTYASDLTLFGEGSLFELLCTARTHLGRERLARYLTESASPQEAIARQHAVKELSTQTVLREQIAQLGRYGFEESKWSTFADWLEAPPSNASWLLRPALLATSASIAALALTSLLIPALWPTLWPVLFGLSALHAVTGAVLLRWVRTVLAATNPVSADFPVIRKALALLASQSFTSSKLSGLSSRVEGADPALAQLDPWFFILRERTKEWWYQLSLCLLLGTQTALALDAWKKRHKEALLDWLDAWAEFEALSALGCYAYENPEDCWPEFHNGPASFEATALGHPLLAASGCVRNDVSLGSEVRLLVVSGSNMAGKSTLLRAIGLASVLALAGAPVRATKLRLAAALQVCASISVTDSLREGRSRFLAEVERLRETLDAALQSPVLFLIDEIFSGTNSRDRHLAADAVIRTLIERRAVGVVSTHDTALASLAVHQGRNVHMASSGSDPLDFDYRLKPGITAETNALAIARMAGVPV